MTVLSDSEIKELLTKRPALIAGFPPNDGFERLAFTDPAWDSAISPIQPCSVDVHIGKIYIPETPPNKLGSHESPHSSFSLDAGMSAVVLSHETLDLPEDICAIALPPSRISSAGVLIANFGHIDPGYKGHLRFTLINMGKESFKLERGALVMTLLLIKTSPVGTPFSVRVQPREDDRPTAAEINCLAPDFANVKSRATEIAKQEVKNSGARQEVLKFFLPMLLAVTSTVFGAGWIFKSSVDADLRRIDAYDKEHAVLTERLDQLGRRMTDTRPIEEAIQRLTMDLERLKALETQRK